MQARRVTGPLALALITSLALASGAALAVEPVADNTVVTPNVYLHSSEGNPWASDDATDNPEAMTRVFGPDDWEEEHFETVDTGTGSGGLFASSVRFIFLDGSDDGTDELDAFLAANESALQAFVNRGGRLIVNAAPNSGDGLLEYDGRQITDVGGDNSSFVVAADGSHPIFNGPFTPAGTSFSGSDFGHALVSGPGLTALILRRVNDDEAEPGDPGSIVLAEYASGSGRVLIGGMTIPFFHDPQPNGDNLRANIIAYAAGDRTPPTSSSTGCVSATEVGVTVTDEAGGSGPASVRYTIDAGAEQTVATDASGSARIAVAPGEHVVAFRGVDNAGNVEATANSVTVTCSTPVEPAQEDDTRPRVAVRGLPSGCVRADFRIRVIARDGGSGVDRVVVRRGARRLVRRSFTGTRRASFTVRVPAAGLRSGRHRIRVGVRDEDGNTRTLRRSFRRCARPAQAAPVSPVLTG